MFRAPPVFLRGEVEGLVDQCELLPGKGLVGRNVRHYGGCRGRSGLGLFPRSLGRGLVASLDGYACGHEHYGRCDGASSMLPPF
jgi:hypothetical protein